MLPQLASFADAITSHPAATFLDSPVMRRRLLLSEDRLRSGKLVETIYAPFEHIERGAELVIVGITPGTTQAEIGLSAAREALRRGADLPEAARAAKIAASFSGRMRENLCGMLDSAGAPGWFGIQTSADLFGIAAHRVHFTSALRNPVFVDGNNYNGQPAILSNRRLKLTIEDTLAAEARTLQNAWWLPLWDVPAAALKHIVSNGLLAADRLLPPIPHPSGGNGENIAWFRGTTKATAFSIRRASTGELLLKRRDAIRAFFASRSNQIVSYAATSSIGAD